MIIVLTNALLGLPPVVVGLALYLLLSRSGPLGAAGLLFTPSRHGHRPDAAGDTDRGRAGASPGIPAVGGICRSRAHRRAVERCAASRLLFALGRASLLTAFLAAFGRAIAEVGAIIIVGGNIRGFTRTMTTAIALETSKGDLPLALGLGLILLALSVAVSTVAFLLVGRVGEK